MKLSPKFSQILIPCVIALTGCSKPPATKAYYKCNIPERGFYIDATEIKRSEAGMVITKTNGKEIFCNIGSECVCEEL